MHISKIIISSAHMISQVLAFSFYNPIKKTKSVLWKSDYGLCELSRMLSAPLALRNFVTELGP